MSSVQNYSRSFLLILLMIYITSCRDKKIHSAGEIGTGKDIIVTASRLRLTRYENFTRVTIIDPWQGAGNVNLEYYLVPKGKRPPAGIDSSMIIKVPIQKIICMSTTHIAMISALNEGNTIAGMSGTGFIYARDLAARVKLGLIADVGYETNLNKELILQIRPDLTMIYGVGNESAGYVGKIRELGIRVIYNADYLETDPLGKAEWIKLFGALYSRESIADSIFNAETADYEKLRSFLAKNVTARPKVLLGLPFKDTWFISPGNSYMSKLIWDAGGDYLWKDVRSSVSMPYGLENVYLKAMEADYWLDIGTVKTRQEISAIDHRLADISCFKRGNLYNNNKRINEKGGNDFWESGALYPHLLLRDIAIILHPELFSNMELLYYTKVY